MVLFRVKTCIDLKTPSSFLTEYFLMQKYQNKNIMYKYQKAVV